MLTTGGGRVLAGHLWVPSEAQSVSLSVGHLRRAGGRSSEQRTLQQGFNVTAPGLDHGH